MSLLFLLCMFVYCWRSGYANIEMCNDDTYQPTFDDLTLYDLERMHKLEQLQIVARHGSRTGDRPLEAIFPRMNTSLKNTQWICNFTSVTSRHYGDKYFMSLSKNYVYGEQYIGPNCVDSQSIWQVIPQQQKNVKLIGDYYIGKKDKNLFSRHELHTIFKEMFVEHKYEDNNTPYIKIISSDLERTYSTAAIFFSYFMEYFSDYNAKKFEYDGDKDYLYSYTHDAESDPYIPQKVKGCGKLKKYIVDRGQNTKVFQDYIASDYIQGFFKQWHDEVGYKFDISYDNFKICENIMWIACAGLDLVPDIISQSLFEKIFNYTYEYRAKMLYNGPVSEETTSLASMPFAWILKTTMSDHTQYLLKNHENIDGYLDAEKAKLLFHSTRGISTLYFLTSLGLSDGMEPVYANLVNFELYSRDKNDYNDTDKIDDYDYHKFLFRITNMGKFLPFPGCEDEYEDGKSTLCNLNVFMKRLNELAMPLVEWEPYCYDIVEKYFDEQPKKKKHKNDKDSAVMSTVQQVHASGPIWCLLIGFLFGGITVCLFDRMSYIKYVFKQKYNSVH